MLSEQEAEMAIYKYVVCAVDFSPHSEIVATRAIELANQFGAQLTLLYVVENFPEDRSNEIIAPEHIDPAEYRKNIALQGLTELCERLQYREASYEILFSMHSAWHEIVRFTGENTVDLIVAGSHGSYGATSLLGSTANGVVNHAPCDVLVVRPHP
jgi:universal stress protein A